MNRDDVIRHLLQAADDTKTLVTNEPNWPLLMRFAALVAAEKDKQIYAICELALRTGVTTEREACALVVENCCSYCAERIRERGEEPKRHPGYIIGDHWLQAAYTRICTGETEDEVMTDYGWQRARDEK